MAISAGVLPSYQHLPLFGDSALSQYHLSTKIENKVMVYGDFELVTRDSEVRIDPFNGVGIIKLSNGQLCTSKERTIIDLIYWDYYIEYILQALDNYEIFHDTLEPVIDLAKQVGMLDKLNEIMPIYKDYLEDEERF